MTQERDERLGLNEALFRDVNERLQELGEAFGVNGERTDFICECGDPACTERISLTLPEYEQVRSEATHFAVRPGHVDATIEIVVSETDRYSVVEKRDPDSVRVVEKLDPRSHSSG